MRTLRMFLVALCGVAMLTGTSSCKKENVGNVAPGEEMHIRASVGGTGGNAKTHLDGLNVAWDSWDAFALFAEDFTEGSRFRFDKLVGDGPAADFVGYCPGEGPYYAGYPYDIVSCSNFNPNADNPCTLEFAIPARQSGNPAEQSESVNAGPMVGYLASQTSGMTFKNVMSWLNIGLKGDATVTKVELTDKSGILYGTLKVTMDDNEISSVAMTGEAANNTLFIEPTEGVALNNDTPTYFQFLVPAGAFAGENMVEIKVTVESGSQTTLTKSFGNGGVAANKVYNAVISNKINAVSGFSVSSTKKVYFSPGNLQYQASTNTWRFAENQYDYVGENNKNISEGYVEWIDLFGWGTSGYNDKYPYMKSIVSTDYGNGNNNISGTDYDWGVYNTISNGGSNNWRTLTGDEWKYLITERDYAADLYGEGKVVNVKGLIILPDDWTLPTGLTFTHGKSDWINFYDEDQWAKMEAAGAVFLPAAGRRYNTTVSSLGVGGGYWSSSYSDSEKAYRLDFSSNTVDPKSGNGYRCDGRSVRLVRDVPNADGNGSAGDFDSGTW